MPVNPSLSQERGCRCRVAVLDKGEEEKDWQKGCFTAPEITGTVMRRDSSWLRSQSLDRTRLVSNKSGIEGLPCDVGRTTYN